MADAGLLAHDFSLGSGYAGLGQVPGPWPENQYAKGRDRQV